ncbi:MAG: hypothetical protein EOO63_03535 [Hymenobacter sp.]|nr:MAG: hypothetical protein EOO63_03535 [Hymenobacter sp.]
MEPDYLPSISLLTRLHNPGWQDQLRHSVRLYLALGAEAPTTLEAELESLLQRTEQQLLDYLLAGEPPTPAARQQAQVFLDMAQHELLSSAAEMQELLEELVAA